MEENAVIIAQSTLYIFTTILTINSGIAIYLLQDYVKFRINLDKNLNKEFMSKEECIKQHKQDNKFLDEKFKNITEKLDLIMKKLED